MLNVAFASLNQDPNPKKSFLNFELGTLWKHGSFNVATTLYLGAFIIFAMLIGFVALLGGMQNIIDSSIISFGLYTFLIILPFMIGYILFIEQINSKSNNETASAKEKSKKKQKEKIEDNKGKKKSKD